MVKLKTSSFRISHNPITPGMMSHLTPDPPAPAKPSDDGYSHIWTASLGEMQRDNCLGRQLQSPDLEEP